MKWISKLRKDLMLLKIYLSNYYYCKLTNQAKSQGCYKILFSYMRKIPRHTSHALRPLEHEQNVFHRRGHLQTLFRGSDQWTVIDLLSGVVADVLQLFLRDFVHRANNMGKGHGSGATTSGHVIFLHNENQGTASFLARFPQLCLLDPRFVTPSQRTQPGNRSWNLRKKGIY